MGIVFCSVEFHVQIVIIYEFRVHGLQQIIKKLITHGFFSPFKPFHCPTPCLVDNFRRLVTRSLFLLQKVKQRVVHICATLLCTRALFLCLLFKACFFLQPLTPLFFGLLFEAGFCLQPLPPLLFGLVLWRISLPLFLLLVILFLSLL